MSIRRAIRQYKENIQKSKDGDLDYELIYVYFGNQPTTSCCGIRWEDMQLAYGELTHKNFKYKLSMKLENGLESFWYPLFHKEEEFRKVINRKKKLKIIDV